MWPVALSYLNFKQLDKYGCPMGHISFWGGGEEEEVGEEEEEEEGYHAIATYLPVTNMTLKFNIYVPCANNSMCLDVGSIPLHMLYKKSIWS